MSLIRIDHNPSTSQLRVFAAIWLVFFGVAGTVVFTRTQSAAATLIVWGLALGVPAVGLASPAFLRLAYLGMAYLSFPVGFVISYVVMVVAYYGVITPTGLLMRLLGHDPMTRRFDDGQKSYWVPRDPERTPASYFRQF